MQPLYLVAFLVREVDLVRGRYQKRGLEAAWRDPDVRHELLAGLAEGADACGDHLEGVVLFGLGDYLEGPEGLSAQD